MNAKKLYFVAAAMNFLAGAVWLFNGNNLGIVFIALGAVFIGVGQSQKTE